MAAATEAAPAPGAPPLLTVADARAARDRARTGAAAKGKEVHKWLGERYLQLVESSDAVVELSAAAKSAAAFVAVVDAEAARAEEAAPAAITEAPAADVGGAAARAAAAAPRFWHALAEGDLAGAAALYLACARLARAAAGPSRAVVAPYVRAFRARVLGAARAFLETPGLDDASEAASRKHADALAALALAGPAPVATT